MSQRNKYYVAAQGLVTHGFRCTGRKVRLARVLELTAAEAAELGALATVRKVELVPTVVAPPVPSAPARETTSSPASGDASAVAPEVTVDSTDEDGGTKSKKKGRRTTE